MLHEGKGKNRGTVVFVSYGEALSPVFESQMINVIEKVSPHLTTGFISFCSVRELARREPRERLRELFKRLKASCRDRTRLLLFNPKHLFWKSSSLPLYLALRSLKGNAGGTILHCRGPVATKLALLVRGFRTATPILFDSRGAAAAEIKSCPENSSFFLFKEEIMRRIEEECYTRADSFLTVSKQLLRYAVSQYGAEESRGETIYPSVDTEYFRFSREARVRIRKELDAGDALLFVYSGSAASWQIPEKIFAFFRRIKSSRGKNRLLILSKDREAYASLRAKHGFSERDVTVKRLAHREVPEYLSAGDMALLLREEDTLNKVASPVKFGEYMACGLPVIMTPWVGDCQEIAGENGTGCVYDDLEGKNPASLAPLLSFIDSTLGKREEIREKCRETALRLYSFDENLSKYLELYGRSLDKHAAIAGNGKS